MKTTTISEKQVEQWDKRWDEYKKGKAKTYSIEEASTLIDKRLKAIRRSPLQAVSICDCIQD
jgi:hypothetical protein